MPPKKSAKGKKSPGLVDGLSTEDMSKDQLEEHIVRLREELDRQREERNYFQLERDKIHTFWEITRRQLEDKKSELRNKDREMEEAEERHQVEIKDLLDSKNNAIKDLQYELARVCKAHNDLLRTYEAKMRAFGIPVDELGFKPLESLVPGQTIGQGPAGLVDAST